MQRCVMDRTKRLVPHGAGFGPATPHGILKSLLENPARLPLHHEGAGKEEKEKLLEEEEHCASPQSAFLGPTLWDKTLPYDADIQLEYMDLEEFLSENGIPSSPAPQGQGHAPHGQGHAPHGPGPVGHAPHGPGPVGHAPHHHHIGPAHHPAPRHPPVMPQAPPTATPSVMDLSSHASTSASHHANAAANAANTAANANGGVSQSLIHRTPTGAGLQSSRNTPSPLDPDSIVVPVGFDPDPADLALSSVPGQEMFDPRKRKFSAEELKPQPMIKKARKIFIPEDLKDDKYWARRRKNNVAAKRSRDARRLKENQIAIRAAFLEKENSALRQEVAQLSKELGRTKNILHKYQNQHGPL